MTLISRIRVPRPRLRLAIPTSRFKHPRPRLTLFGRSLLLLSSELLINAVCWIAAGLLFGRKHSTRPILSLALLAWTIGLRHALDADHIRSESLFDTFNSAIDNATRSLISLGQLPVTCGLYFSLGHSTIVIVVNVAIAISTSVYDHIDGVGKVGGIVGAAVSGSFLFIVGLANSIILWRVLAKRRRIKKDRARRIERGEDPLDIDDELDQQTGQGNTLMMKLIGPVVTFVDRPWKMYPVGVLFGFGFDTASSIALLAVSAIAKKDSEGNQIPSSNVVVLPLLFTAGMTMIDSVDSIVMLYSYSGFPERGFAVFEPKKASEPPEPQIAGGLPEAVEPHPVPTQTPPLVPVQSSKVPSPGTSVEDLPASPLSVDDRPPSTKPSAKGKAVVYDEEQASVAVKPVTDEDTRRLRRVKRNAMSGLSIMLTLMSILVAFSISLITIMGLIGDNCGPCQMAANDPDGGGLAGRWWRGWAAANDNSGYIGAAIVGSFVTIVGLWYGLQWVWRRIRSRHLSI